ncbi:GxxExxY protein [Lacunimicrobium album]
MEINEITGIVIDAAMKVHTHLGPGLLESAYQSCLAFELEDRGISFELEVPLDISYAGRKVHSAYRLDMVVKNRVIIELKAVEKILPVHEAQLISYLKLSGLKVGLLINFHEKHLKDGITRRIL